MNPDYINTMYYLRDILLCVGFLVGMIVGIFLIVRKHVLAGILAILGFALIGLEPIIDYLIFRVLYAQELSDAAYTTLEYAYPCISAPAIFIGTILLVVALILAVRNHKPPASTQPPAPPSPEGDLPANNLVTQENNPPPPAESA
jgi:hypothetical protein